MSGILNELVGTKFNAAPSTSYNKQTVLLLAGDGTNGAQNNTFIDGSSNAFTMTATGNATQGTFSPFSSSNGYWSNYFNGVSSLNCTTQNFSTNNFTIEMWVYLAGNQTDVQILAGYNNITTSRNYAFYINASGGLGYYLSSNGTSWDLASGISFGSYSINSWNHIALVRNGNTFTPYVNGVAGSTTTSSAAIFTTSGPMWIGSTSGNTNNITGYISNFRTVIGTSVYTSAFTPPTAPLTAITNTSLLTCQSNSFKDNSTNNFTITPSGTPRVSNFCPFAPTSAYSTSTNGGSGYFDGNSDYLSTPNVAALRLGAGDFTVEAWIYPFNLTNTYGQTICGTYGSVSGVGDTGWALLMSAAGYLRFGIFGPSSFVFAFNSNSLLSTNTWTHVAAVRSGTTVTLYINGVADGTGTTNYNEASSSSSFYVATSRLDGETPTIGNTKITFTGYISNVRFVKGTAVYTSNFTTPTAPLTAITNTSILLNSVNAGVIDNSETNNVETVGNVQISTSVKKYGSGSMSFDGTGDWLLILDKPELRFQAASFTVECWLYLNATGAASGVVGKGTSTTGWLLSTNTSNQVVFTYGSSTITSTASLSASKWYHIAVVRSGTGTNQTKIYLNGVNDGTGTVANTFSETNSMYVGADRTAGSALNGYIDDMRITNGVAVYTSNFTPPTAALPLY